MAKLNINVVCGEANGGWIYSQFIDQFRRYSKHTIVVNSKTKCDLTHYLPYFELNEKPPGPSTSWHSHQELKNPLHNKFITVGKLVDVAISHSKKYADILKSHGVSSAVQVIPGVDTSKFKLRDTVRKAKTTKIIVGYIGRAYTSSNRKNPSLLNRISKLPYVDFRTTGGKLAPNSIPNFYAGLDMTVSPATIEGGPMAIQESLSCGVPVVCMNGVGVSDEYSDGVYRANDNNHFVKIIKRVHDEGLHIHDLRKPEIMSKLRDQVIDQTWKVFVQKHDEIWSKVYDARR